MGDWTHEASIEATATAPVVWSLSADVATWPTWNAGAAAIDLHGPFATGSIFTMRLPDGEALLSTLVDVDPEKCFVDETIVGVVCLSVARRVTAMANGSTRITYASTVDGPDAAAVGAAVTADVDDALASLKHRAEHSPIDDGLPASAARSPASSCSRAAEGFHA